MIKQRNEGRKERISQILNRFSISPFSHLSILESAFLRASVAPSPSILSLSHTPGKKKKVNRRKWEPLRHVPGGG